MTATTTCFDWCNGQHGDDSVFLHEQDGTLIPTINGKPVDVALFHDDRTSESGISVGDSQFTPDAAIALAYELLTSADLALRLDGSERAGLKQMVLAYSINRTGLAELVRLSGGDR